MNLLSFWCNQVLFVGLWPCDSIYCGPFFACVSQCFAVRSLGWVEMAEEDLAPGKSSVAVNNCIRQLSYSKNDIRDTVGIWGEVREGVVVL